MDAELTVIADNLWGYVYDLRLGPGFYLPVRTTVIRRGDGGLVLWSPGPLDDRLASAIAALGEVRAIVAPNRLHHLYAGDAQRRFPAATLLLAPGLAEKRPDLEGSALVDGAAALGPEFELLAIAGATRLGEVVALHRPSASLLVTDLVFNLQRTRGWLTPWVLRVGGVLGRYSQSRLIRTLVDDRAAAGASVQALLRWPFERVVICHGDLVEGDDLRERTAAALQWMLAAAPPA
ncbi:MAG: hypothetical protein R3A79_20605 [Nannocystaceae bacterium]